VARTAINAKPIGARPPTPEFHSSDVKIEQKPDIVATSHKDRETDIIKADKHQFSKEYLDELAFNEEPVTIRLEPSTDKNASTRFPVWVNGKPGEIYQRGKWEEIGYFPTGTPFVTKRKYLAVIVGAKIDNITHHDEAIVDNNVIRRFTSALHSFSVIEDKNPKGHEWLTRLLRANMG